MKRYISLVLAFALLTVSLYGCKQAPGSEILNPDGRLHVVCTSFPQYDWVRQIAGRNADNMALTLLLSGGVDLHNYQPTVDDIVKISSCDLFIYVGGESDGWVSDALAEAVNPNMVIINLREILGTEAKTEEITEGMEEELRHTDNIHEHDHENVTEYDEHVWLSLRNAGVFCTAIADALSSLDNGNSLEYKNNLTDYAGKLSALDEQYRAAVNAAPVKTLLFGDRFPFRYLVDDYALSYYAAFPGCSAETEAGFDTIVFLSRKADELGLNSIMVTESSDRSIAKTIIDNTQNKDRQILVLDSMQSVTGDSIQNGTTYLSVAESNLNVLKEALR